MWIPEFWVGVLSTILVEITGLVLIAIYTNNKKR